MTARDASRPIAIVLSADTNGLGAIRSLHKEGVRTIAVADSRSEPVLASWLPAEKILLDSAALLDDAIVRAFEPFRGESPVVIATSDRYVAALERVKDRLLPEFRYGTLPRTLADALIDKRLEAELIRETGVEMPLTISRLSDDPTELDALTYPVIVKPRDYEHFQYLGRKNVILSDAREGREFLDAHAGELWRFIAQQVIPGGDRDLWVCNCVFNENHELATAHVFRRLKTSPAHYGVTSYAVSERNADVLSRVRTLGRELGYVGPAMVEFKHDERDGAYRYIEINPRIGLCNYFDTRSGMNNVYSTYRLYADGAVAPMTGQQKQGVVYLSFYEDSYARRKDGESIPQIARDYLGNLFRPHAFAYFCFHDPWPWVRAVAAHARDVAVALARRAKAVLGLKGRRDP